MTDDKKQDNTVMNGVSYFSLYFSPSPCEIAFERSEQNEVISHRRKRRCPNVFSPLDRYHHLYRAHLRQNNDIETICELNCQTFLEVTDVGKLKM